MMAWLPCFCQDKRKLSLLIGWETQLLSIMYFVYMGIYCRKSGRKGNVLSGGWQVLVFPSFSSLLSKWWSMIHTFMYFHRDTTRLLFHEVGNTKILWMWCVNGLMYIIHVQWSAVRVTPSGNPRDLNFSRTAAGITKWFWVTIEGYLSYLLPKFEDF